MKESSDEKDKKSSDESVNLSESPNASKDGRQVRINETPTIIQHAHIDNENKREHGDKEKIRFMEITKDRPKNDNWIKL